jgi:TPR repeat protein
MMISSIQSKTWLWLSALTAVTALLPVQAAEPESTLAANDWHQLWPETRHRAWLNKSESDLRRLAENGHATAQFVLWEKWRGTRAPEASNLLAAATAAGLPQAMYQTGLGRFTGTIDTRPAKREGWALMEKAAAAGYLKAEISVAEYDAGFVSVYDPSRENPRLSAFGARFASVIDPIESGPLLKPNFSRALEYFRDAVRNGTCHSQLARLYSSGIGEPRDESESPHNLLLTAARQGDVGAMLSLSDRYAYGHGERVDLLEAARWRFLAWQQNPSERFDMLDPSGNPKIQEDLIKTDLAELLSLMVKAVEFADRQALAALKGRYADAGKPERELNTLLNAKATEQSPTPKP